MIDATRLASHIDATIRALRHRWEQTYGWTHLSVRSSVDVDARMVTLHGSIVNAPLRRRLAAVARSELPIGFTLRVDVQPLQGRGWRSLGASKSAVYREHPRMGQRQLATELLLHDGPVEVLHEEGPHALIRGRDGTMGWTSGLGPAALPVPFVAPRTWSQAAFTVLARSYLGVRYRLGGTTREGVDCSGLVARAFGQALGGLLPRHSRDQLSIAPAPGLGRAEQGDLVFIWGEAEARCHVAIVSDEAHCTHASRTRGVVVEEPLADLIDHAERVMHVRFRDLAAFQLRIAGCNSIAQCFELGGREHLGGDV